MGGNEVHFWGNHSHIHGIFWATSGVVLCQLSGLGAGAFAPKCIHEFQALRKLNLFYMSRPMGLASEATFAESRQPATCNLQLATSNVLHVARGGEELIKKSPGGAAAGKTLFTQSKQSEEALHRMKACHD